VFASGGLQGVLNLTMRPTVNLILIALIVLSLTWACAPSRNTVSGEQKVAVEGEDTEIYQSPRNKAYYHFLRSRELLYQNRVDEALNELEMAASEDPAAAFLFAPGPEL
jgi:hypothetical protein